MVVNDDAGFLKPRGALGFFASVLAPTVLKAAVGASRLAMVVNDDAGFLKPRGALGFFASVLATG
jgi:putative alpha-1,2-mannosidase